MRNLRKLRRVAGMTQYVLAKKARVSRSKVADVETDRAEFTDSEKRRVLTVLGAAIVKNAEEASASLRVLAGESGAIVEAGVGAQAG